MAVQHSRLTQPLNQTDQSCRSMHHWIGNVSRQRSGNFVVYFFV